MAGTFSATVDAWTRKSKKRMLYVFLQSVQDVVEKMQTPVGSGGNMPVDTGFLRSSLQASINVVPSGYMKKTKDSYVFNESQYSMTIGNAKLGDTIYAVYAAKYAGYQEYGSQGREGRGFVRLAAQQWQSIVRANVGKAQSIK